MIPSQYETKYTTSKRDKRLETSEPDSNRRRRSKNNQKKGLEAIYTVNIHFRRALDYRTYRLKNKPSMYDHKVSKNIRKMSNQMTAQMKHPVFDLFNSISITGLQWNFRLASVTEGIHGGAAIWLFHFLMKKSASSTLHTRLLSKHKAKTNVSISSKTTTLTTYPQVVNFLLQTYKIDENVADTEEE